MGQCIYVALGWPMDGEPPVTREMKSEQWMDPAAAGRALNEGQFLNTTTGVWFYELDLQDKAKLREKLLALVEHVTAPEFLAKYDPARPEYDEPEGR